MISLRKKPSKHSVNTDIMRGNPSSVTSAGGTGGRRSGGGGGGLVAFRLWDLVLLLTLKKSFVRQ